MQNINHLQTVSTRAKAESCLDILNPTDEPPFSRSLSVARRRGDRRKSRSPDNSVRGTKRTDDLRFLNMNSAPPFVVRLARELAEAVRVIGSDPLAFINALPEAGPLSPEKRSRMRAGVGVAITFYALALSGIYASYAIFHDVKATVPPAHHFQITYLASPPITVTKTALPLKAAGSGTRKDQLMTAIEAAEQPKAESTEAKPTPRPPEQALNRTEPTKVNSESSSRTSEPASRVSASEGAARGLTGNAVGTASDGGRGAVSSANVNYNAVFSISGVTTRPQILARPVPGYTEEARRAHIEGAVKLSVVLDASGGVSDIRVARGLGYGLDEKAVEAARQLRFVPAEKDGHPVSVRVSLEFKFALL